MAKAEYLMLAHVFDPAKHSASGAYMSQKLDGFRAFWDGGISRGRPCSEVPYANTVKDHIAVVPPVATGLWSRTGKPIMAPDWFLNMLPNYPLDGELWMGYKSWQSLSKTVSQLVPDDRWRLVEFKIFDSPSYENFFKPREVKVRNDYTFKVGRPKWHFEKTGVPAHWTFEFVQKWLSNRFSTDGQISLVQQIELPLKLDESVLKVHEYVERVCEAGGEGVMIRKRNSIWSPERVYDLLKFKPEQDDEGVVTGYYSGKETDKGSKLLGMMGALELEWQGATFKISGFTDEEREFESDAMKSWAAANPGVRCPDWFQARHFPVGSRVTFKYRELSDDGIPKEARYLRVPVE